MGTATALGQQGVLHTRYGRAIGVSRYGSLGMPQGQGKVVLETASERFEPDEVWASLTATEARQLAGLLLRQAAAVERPAAEPAGLVEVAGAGGHVYGATVRGHLVTVDQPVGAGGSDAGPTPVDLLVVSLATCVAHYCGNHLDHHRVPRTGLRVTAEYTMAAAPPRVASIALTVRVPGLPPERADALLAVARFCTVHNTLARRPEVTIGLDLAPSGPAS